MVDVNMIYKSNSDNIKAEDIGNNMWTLTISSADVKKFSDTDSKIVLTFHEWEKSLPLNYTNAQTIAGIYGQDSNSWVGQQIMLFTMPVTYQGKQTLGVRVRAPGQMSQPQQPAQPQPQPQQQYRPGAMQPQAHTRMGPSSGYQPQQNSPQQNSPQRPLNGPQQDYSRASGGGELPHDDIPFGPEFR